MPTLPQFPSVLLLIYNCSLASAFSFHNSHNGRNPFHQHHMIGTNVARTRIRTRTRTSTSTKDVLPRIMSSLSKRTSSSLSSAPSSIHDSDPPVKKLTKSIAQTKSNKISFAIAGGGASAISSLASTPGASAVFLNGSVLYDRNSFCQYISQHQTPTCASQTQANDVDGVMTMIPYKTPQGQFGFASSGAAVLLSKAALHHAFQLSSLDDMSHKVLGIGCTSTLVSHGREDRNSRAHISVVRGDGMGVLWNVRLSNEGFSNGVNGSDSGEDVGEGMSTVAGNTRRDRWEEENVLAQLILSSIQKFDSASSGTSSDQQIGYSEILDRSGDVYESTTFRESNYDEDNGIFVQNAAQNVIDDDNGIDAVVIAQKSTDSSFNAMLPLAHTVIPVDPIIFPGSFNPPHLGHTALAKAAVKTMTRKKREELKEYFQRKEGGSDGKDNTFEDMWNTTEFQSFKSITDETLEEGPFSVLFEMSLTNADKPPMEASEASRRASLFGQVADGGENNSQIPNDWGVLLTSSPLFIDKARLIKKYLAPSSSSFIPNKRQMTFVIGTDTMVRIINPKYYGNDYENMLEAIREMGDEGVHFVVGGRLEQIKGNENGEKETRFVTGEEELEGLPEDVRGMFTIIQENDFRVDISSSELRAKMSSDTRNT